MLLVGPKIGDCFKREFYEREIMSARTVDGYFQHGRIFASRAVAPLATSISIVSSVPHFGVSFVSGEVAHHVCRHEHTVDSNSGAEHISCWVTHRQSSLA